jgi:DNA polymerase-3 subunit chi
MTKIDFYITPDSSPQAREQLACRLANKAYQSGSSVYIHTESEQQAKSMDDKLWIFQAGSFIPHELYQPGSEPGVPVLIGHQAEPEITRDFMINLCHQVPIFFSRFLRVAELVDSNVDCKALARERFRFYRERGYPLQSHELSN